MALTYSPLIKREEYPFFAKMIAGMPQTFEAWEFQRHSKDVKSGMLVRSTAVSPAAFAEYVRRPGNKATLTALYAFAFEVGSRREREKADPPTRD